MRLIFINPVSLPSMTDGYLRKDFNFAMYLGYCYGQILIKFFRWSLFSLIFLLLIIITFNIAFDTLDNKDIEMYIKFSGLFICFIVILSVKACMTRVERKVTPNIYKNEKEELYDPHNFDILFNDRPGAVDPMVRYDWLPRMCYLDFDS